VLRQFRMRIHFVTTGYFPYLAYVYHPCDDLCVYSRTLCLARVTTPTTPTITATCPLSCALFASVIRLYIMYLAPAIAFILLASVIRIYSDK